MKLTVLNSGSKGNGYVIENDSEALIIEAGVRLSKAKEALDFNISKVQGCIVSHSHQDHAKYIKEYADAGITVMGPGELFKTAHSGYRDLTHGKGYKAGGFKVIPFKVVHDVPCFGYLIDHEETGRILFLTDTAYTEYKVPELRHMLIEANYADDILEKSIEKGKTHPVMKRRLMTTHMEFQTTKRLIKANDISKVNNIVLIHLSDSHSDENRFVREIIELTSKNVFCARKGLIVELNNEPF